MTNDYGILANYIVEKYRERISGNDIPDKLIGESPVDRVMVGMLSEDRNETGLDGEYKENMDSRFESVPSISLTFVVKKNDEGVFCIIPRGLLFYSILPEYDEVVEYILNKHSEQDGRIYLNIDELCDAHPTDNFYIPQVYKKIDIEKSMGTGIEINISELKTAKISLQDKITEKLSVLADEIRNEIRIVPDSQLSFFDLKTKETFAKVCSAKDQDVSPRWTFDITCHLVDEGEYM